MVSHSFFMLYGAPLPAIWHLAIQAML